MDLRVVWEEGGWWCDTAIRGIRDSRRTSDPPIVVGQVVRLKKDHVRWHISSRPVISTFSTLRSSPHPFFQQSDLHKTALTNCASQGSLDQSTLKSHSLTNDAVTSSITEDVCGQDCLLTIPKNFELTVDASLNVAAIVVEGGMKVRTGRNHQYNTQLPH
jgi:hypothetical protein